MRWRRTAIWGAVLLALAVFANWPQGTGPLKLNLWHAGFPVTYAAGIDGEVEISFMHLSLDALCWLTAIILVLALLSRLGGQKHKEQNGNQYT